MSYWLVALFLIVFGVLAAFSIGLPFLVLGLAMLLLGPFRGRPRLFIPALLAVVAFVVAASLVVPWSCEASSTSDGGSFTVCRGILGPTWAGPGVYNPPPEASWLGVIGGLVAGGVSGAVTYVLMGRGAGRRFLTRRSGDPDA